MEHNPFTQVIPLNDSVVCLVGYILYEGSDTYITGIGLLKEENLNEPEWTLGYRLPDDYILVDIGGKKLKGFTIAAGEAGVHAIRPIFSNAPGNWIGNPIAGDIQASKDLIVEQGIQAMSGKFDVSHFCLW